MMNATSPSTKPTAIPASLLTYIECAALTGLTTRTLQRAVADGQLLVHRFGHRTVRIARGDLDAWVNGNRSGALAKTHSQD